MTNHPLLLIHAGMRPGELVLAHSGGRDPIFLPPCDKPHKFVVGNDLTKQEWAIMRTTLDGGVMEPLLIFTSRESADAALSELLAALLEPAKEETQHPKPSMAINLPPPWVAVVAFLVFIMLLVHFAPATQNAQPQPESSAVSSPISSAPVATVPYPNAPQSDGVTPGPSDTQSTFHPPTAATPPAKVSPGDALLQQIQGNH